MSFLLKLAWQDLRASGRSLWIFVACLVLGVSLVTAGGGLYRQVADALRSDARLLFGGDAEVRSNSPLPAEALAWMEQGATVSRLVELRTMLRAPDGRAQLIELQSADARYPLYGEVTLSTEQRLQEALQDGAALDATLAARLGLAVGDVVEVGDASLRVSAFITRQPDRSLRADWSGAPVLVSDAALTATGLVQPLSRVVYRYRVRTDTPSAEWRMAFASTFPQVEAEIRTFDERNERMAEVLGQIGSGLLLIGFASLFIGGLGVFNSVQAYLQGKLASLATLRALGLRDGRLAFMVLVQILMLALLASLAGAVVGNLLAWMATWATAATLPLKPALHTLAAPTAVAVLFGVLTALMFALPPLGRALSVSPAVLFRGNGAGALRTPQRIWWGTTALVLVVVGLLLSVLPDSRFGLAFVVAVLLLLVLLEGLTRLLRRGAAHLQNRAAGGWPVELQLALAGLQQPASPLRVALLSLGSALTLLVACTLVVAALLRTVNETVPANAPALVFYDVQQDQQELLRDTLAASPSLERLQLAPLVLGRLASVNGEALRESADDERALESRDEHKLSNRAGNIDDVVVTRGAWWPEDYAGPPLVAFEDREADELGIEVGDRLVFDILGAPVEAQVAAIYSQRRTQARLWLEGIFTDGTLDPFITRYVGAAYLNPQEALQAQDRLAGAAPNIATVRTEALLTETRVLLGRATAGLAVVAGVCLAASLLVLASVVAASRTRQIYDATIMHALGARHSVLRRVLYAEYALLAVVTAGFAMLAGTLLASGLLQWRLGLSASGLLGWAWLTALGVSGVSLGLGARYLLAHMRLSPALLLRTSS